MHWVFDDKNKNTKTLAANDRSPAQNNYFICKIICDVGGIVTVLLLYDTCPAHHMTVWDAISRTMSAN